MLDVLASPNGLVAVFVPPPPPPPPPPLGDEPEQAASVPAKGRTAAVARGSRRRLRRSSFAASRVMVGTLSSCFRPTECLAPVASRDGCRTGRSGEACD